MNKRFYILALRSPASLLGPASAIAKSDGQELWFETWEEAQAAADKLNEQKKSRFIEYQVEEACFARPKEN